MSISGVIKLSIQYILITYCILSQPLQAQRIWGMSSYWGLSSAYITPGRPDFELAGNIFSIDKDGGDFKVEKEFLVPRDGSNPYGSLILGNDQCFYGMCTYGGDTYNGTIFKMKSTGELIKLRDFGTIDGVNPRGDLVAAQDGYFYGMCENGGIKDMGTIFKIDSNGVFTKLLDLSDTTGISPEGNLIQGKDGYLYGMAASSYTSNKNGVIFRISTNGVYKKLWEVTLTSDGGNLDGSLTEGSDGYFYGMGYSGGANGLGTIFKIDSNKTFVKIMDLSTVTGSNPRGHLILAFDGYFYGTCSSGGVYNSGTIFKISTGGAFTKLRDLNTIDGINPFGSLFQGSDGLFYGTCLNGGVNGQGTIYKINSTGIFTKLRDCGNYVDGGLTGSLVQGTDGDFYGMSPNGNPSSSRGIIFKISSDGTFNNLRNLSNSIDGAFPFGSLINGKDGSIYGMCGSDGINGSGTIFKISNGIFSKIYDFSYDTGAAPLGSLVQGKDGFFYGMTPNGGTGNYGMTFKISSTGVFTKLRNNSISDGYNPNGNLIEGTDGYFYGMCGLGGLYGTGTIFKINSSGNFIKLHDFASVNDGGNPYGSLLLASDGFFYGMCNRGGTNQNGTIFKLSSTGTFTNLFSFTRNTDGGYPNGNLIQSSNGYLYGMCTYGGTNDEGTIFKISTSGVFTKLKDLSNVDDGRYPNGSLIQIDQGDLYGMCTSGGLNDQGTLFKITSGGTFTKLIDFNGSITGIYPNYTSLLYVTTTVSEPNVTNIELSIESKLIISPNPSSGSFTIKGEVLSYTDLIVCNAIGSVVKSITAQGNNTVKIEGLNSGVYIIQAGSERRKVTVQ